MESWFAYANVAFAELSALPDWMVYVFFGILALVMRITALCCFCTGWWCRKTYGRYQLQYWRTDPTSG
eukprot:14802148-Alexandrium_andersonii.AAC.1